MAIVRWSDPFRDLSQLQDRLNRAFSYRGDDGVLTSGSWLPPVDIFQGADKEVVLKAELPGMTREDIDITVDDGTLTVKGEKKALSEVKDEQYHRIERQYGSFSRSFSLPRTLDASKIAAEFKNGILTIRVPLREEAKPRQIKVDIAA